MNEVIKDYLARISSLYELEPKNLPMEIIVELSKMETSELYKTCTQLSILLYNVPTKDKILNLTKEEIENYSTLYANEILKRVAENH